MVSSQWLPGAGNQEKAETLALSHSQTRGADWSDGGEGGLLLVRCRTWKSVTDQTCRQLVTITNINSQFHQLPISIRSRRICSKRMKCTCSFASLYCQGLKVWVNVTLHCLDECININSQTTDHSCNFLISPLSIMSGWYQVPKNTFL